MKRIGLVGCLCIATFGCATIDGEPDALPANRDITSQVIETTLESGNVSLLLAPGAQSQADRNEVIFAQIAAIDVAYFAYETRSARQLRKSSFLLALVQIAIGSAGAFATEGASQALSAASAALAGGEKAFKTEVLVERTIDAFQKQMRAQRDLVRASIIAKLPADTTTYPVQAAISDLAAYRQAGTLTGALLAISADASASAAAAQDKVARTEEEVLGIAFATTIDNAALQEFLPGGLPPHEHARRVKLINEMTASLRRTGHPSCTDDVDVLVYSASPNCVGLQRQLVRLLTEMGEMRSGANR